MKELVNRLAFMFYEVGGVQRTVVKSWDGKTEIRTEGSAIDRIQNELYSRSQSTSISADKTHYESWEGYSTIRGLEGSLRLTHWLLNILGTVPTHFLRMWL